MLILCPCAALLHLPHTDICMYVHRCIQCTYAHTHLCILWNDDSEACLFKCRCAVIDISDGDLDWCGCWLWHQAAISSNDNNAITPLATVKVQISCSTDYSSGGLRVGQKEGWGEGRRMEERMEWERKGGWGWKEEGKEDRKKAEGVGRKRILWRK